MTTREASLLSELHRVHDMLRRDLAAVKEIAAATAAGPTAQTRDDLNALHAQGPLLQLKANCLGYCQLVHSHHGGEDSMLFPAVRQAAPHLAAPSTNWRPTTAPSATCWTESRRRLTISTTTLPPERGRSRRSTP